MFSCGPQSLELVKCGPPASLSLRPLVQSRSGVANLYHKWAKILIKKVQGAKFLIKIPLGAKLLQFQLKLLVLYCLSHLKKSLRAISKAHAGQKWPAGPALAAPGLEASWPSGLMRFRLFVCFTTILYGTSWATQLCSALSVCLLVCLIFCQYCDHLCIVLPLSKN